jgi:hypothetical protein
MTIPIQPQPAGSDGYGVILGSTLRRDPYTPVYMTVPITYTTAHQINNSQANPSIYLPEMSVTPGNRWRFSFRLVAQAFAAVGEPKVKFSAEWYNSSNVMIHEDVTPYQNNVAANVVDSEGMNWFQPTLEATVPANATKVHPVIAMQFVYPLNAYAIWKVLYELLP